MIKIKKCTFDELHTDPNFELLVQEAASAPEVVIEGLDVKVKVDNYRHLEASGSLHILGAYCENKLVGFSFVLFPTLNHHEGIVAVADTLFVSEEYRKTGAGLQLIKETEEYTKNNNSVGLIFSTAIGSIMFDVLTHLKYKVIRKILYRKFDD